MFGRCIITYTLVLWVGWGLCKEMTEIEALSSKPTKCTYEHAFEMYGAHCAGLRLSSIPNLKSGIEILDFSDNKLRELHSDTLSDFSSIKFLYLAENQIYLIDDDAFTYLTYLQTLDLSKNVITELPNAVFQLPSLRKLYLGGNPLIHISASSTLISKPIKAPLELLDISDCKIRELPDWGVLPQLVVYNISHNPLMSIEARHFALMCNLGKVDMKESVEKLVTCEMKPSILWFQEKHVSFELEDYSRLNSKEFQDCSDGDFIGILNSTHRRCKSEYLQIQNIKQSRRTWLTIGGGLAGFLVGFILLLYVMHRHNVAQTKKNAQKLKAVPIGNGDRNATAVLLNDMS